MRDDRELERGDGVRSGEDSAELLEGIRRGDGAAFETLARLHAPRMLRLALHLCGNRADAEDLVQETLVRALPALRKFEGRARLSTYLARALGNGWRNRLRARSRSKLVAWFRGPANDESPGETEFDPPDPGPSPQESLESRERAREIRGAIACLEPARRLTLLLREVEEMSYEEIAEATGVAIGTVRSRLARARDDLRRSLGGDRGEAS